MKTHALLNAHKVRTPHRPQNQPSKIPYLLILFKAELIFKFLIPPMSATHHKSQLVNFELTC